MCKKRLYIVNAQPGGNKGAEAMLETLVQQLIGRLATDKYEIWMESLNDSPAYGHFCDRLGIPHNLFRFSPRRLGRPYDIEPNSNDIMIDIGGINYTDKSIIANLRNFRRHELFGKSGSLIIFFTQDFGPARRIVSKVLGRRAMKRAEQIFSRSSLSLRLLKDVLPDARVSGPHPDCTLILSPVAPPIKPKARYVALVPSAIMMNDHGELYMSLMSRIGEVLPEDILPVVLAHNFTKNSGTFDTAVCKELHARLSKKREALLIDSPWAPSELKGLLAGAEAVITSRFHAMVGAMASNVPAFAIGWSHKYEEFMSLYGKTDFSFDFKNLTGSSEEVCAAADDIVNRALGVSGDERESFRSVNADLRQQVSASFQQLCNLIER